jgi:NAD(P)-dependent dehydrogenase (short-subunit alcohol dehydrogenase family)
VGYAEAMGRLRDRIVVITGSTRGLGRAAAEAFLREGARVVISGRTEQAARVTAEALDPSGQRVLAIGCDVSRLEEVRALSQRTLERFGGFDVWVNNAGLSAPYGPTADLAAERFAEVLQVNILGTFHGAHVALQHLLARRAGTLINILGRGDTGTVPLQLAYSSTKWWMKAFTRSLAKENEGRGVAVMAYNPGLMTTDILTQLEAVEGYEAALAPLKTIVRMWGNPAAVPAERLVTLASAEFAHRNGHLEALLGPARMVGGALREGARRLFGKPDDVVLNVTSVRRLPR